MDALKQRLLDNLKFFQAFCKEHGLRYIGCGGTVLGAVRHKGFIPWDDDIDLYMPRADYERFLSLSEELRSRGYEVQTVADKGYYCPFGKLSDLRSTVWEFERLPFIMGVSIDLFPLDEFDESDEVITARQYRSHYYFDKYINAVSRYSCKTWRRALCDALKGRIHQLGLHVLNLWRKTHPQHYLDGFVQYEKQFIGGHGPKCVCLPQWEGKIFRTEWFEDVIELPFEDTTVTCPRDYDAYLRLLYGDYMQLPPEDRRIQHPHFYLNLERRLTLEEICAG